MSDETAVVLTNEVHWNSLDVAGRTASLEGLADDFTERREAFALLLEEELGKPQHEAFSEVQKCIDHIRIMSHRAVADEVFRPQIVKDPANDQRDLVKRRRPLGQILVITPWNFPLWLSFKTIIPALVAGNRVLHRPSSATPRLNKLLIAAIERSSLPLGVWDLRPGMTYADVSSSIASPEIQGVSFTGGSDAGRVIASQAGQALKPLVLELGGSDLMIISPDFGDHELAAQKALRSRLANNGQVCVATKRVAINSSESLEEFLFFLKSELDAHLKLSLPEVRDNRSGVMVTSYHAEVAPEDYIITRLAHESHFKQCVKDLSTLLEEDEVEIFYGDLEWLELAQSGQLEKPQDLQFPPFVVTNIDVGSPFWNRKEFMCPVLLISKPNQYEEVIRRASIAGQNVFGLGGSVFLNSSDHKDLITSYQTENKCSPISNRETKGLSYPLSIIREMRSGMLAINETIVSHPYKPFGGVDESGYGRECGVEGLLAFTYLQTIEMPHKIKENSGRKSAKSNSISKSFAGGTKALGHLGGYVTSQAAGLIGKKSKNRSEVKVNPSQ